jgi:hypothetical protein
MSTMLWLRDLSIAECLLCLCVLGIMFYKRQMREFGSHMGLIGVRALSILILTPLLFFRQQTGLNVHTAYRIYFYTYWISAIVLGLMLVVVIYSVYNKAMKPLKGLQRIGRVIFRWVAVVSVAVSIAIAVGPHLSIAGYTSSMVWAMMVSQIQQGTSVLTLCLLLFVCFAIRPLGLTFRSRIFGVTLGLGVTATTFLVQAAWLATVGARSVYSPIYLVSTVGSLISVCIWTVYFALPEPERKMILLPTTSPFFTWNRISEALGDEPGFVAVAGFKPDMLAPAELKVLSSPMPKKRITDTSAPVIEPASRSALHTIAVSQ